MTSARRSPSRCRRSAPASRSRSSRRSRAARRSPAAPPAARARARPACADRLARHEDPCRFPRGVRRPARRAGAGPRRARPGRGARPARSLRRLPHRPLHRLGRRGGPRRLALLAPVRRVPPLPVAEDEPLPRDPRAAGKGYLPDGTTRLSRRGEPIRHFMGCSTFGEYTVMPEIALAKINPEAPLDRACLFACGLSTGLGAVAGCRLAGAERIVCVDLSEERLALATGQGATETMVGGPDAVQQILDMTGGFGADYTFEATGNVKVMRQAVEAARMGWGLCTVAGVAGKGETLDVIPRWLITGRRVAGSSFGGVKGREQVPEYVERYLAGDIDVDAFLSHRISLDEVNRAFELMEAQDGIRSVISFA